MHDTLKAILHKCEVKSKEDQTLISGGLFQTLGALKTKTLHLIHY